MNLFSYFLDYDEPLFRPPSEAFSMIFQVTLGCSWNKCSFCEMYKSKSFTSRKEEDVLEEIRRAGETFPEVKKVFLADGNAFVLSSSRLLRILDALKKSFPSLSRVSSYALPRDILSKSSEELVSLREAGLQLIYVGIESGDDNVLKMVDKGESADSTVEGLLKAQEAGIQCSVMIINGLAGSQYYREHALNSALLVNRVQPRYLSTLVLTLPYGLPKYQKQFKGIFHPMTELELLEEMKIFIENLELERTVFRSDHASNFLILKGTLNRDKEEFLTNIKKIRSLFHDNPSLKRSKPHLFSL